MSDIATFPQHGDEPDAAFFAFLAGMVPGPGCVVSGLTFSSVDYSNLVFDVDRGKAVIHRSNMSTASADVDPSKTLDDVVNAVMYPGGSAISLTDNTVNEIYLDANVGTNDSATVEVDPTVTDDMLKIGEIDTSGNTTSEQWYLVSADGTLTFPTETAADNAATNLREGTVVYARNNDTHYFVN